MHIMNVCVKKVKMKKFLVCKRKYVGFVILYVGLCVCVVLSGLHLECSQTKKYQTFTSHSTRTRARVRHSNSPTWV